MSLIGPSLGRTSYAGTTLSAAAPAAGPSLYTRFSDSLGSFNQEYGALLGGIAGGAAMIGSGISQAQSFRAEGRAAKYAADYNAALANSEGIYEHNRIRRMARSHLSSQYAQMNAKSGVIGEEGGWLEVIANNASAYEVDALNAVIRARNTAALERHKGAVAMADAKHRAGSALLTGITSGLGAIARVV